MSVLSELVKLICETRAVSPGVSSNDILSPPAGLLPGAMALRLRWQEGGHLVGVKRSQSVPHPHLLMPHL